MKVIALTEEHDLQIVNGDLVLLSDADAVVQLVKQRVLFHQGEWDFDTDAGIDWVGTIYAIPYNPIIAESALKREILATPGITKLTSFDYDVDIDRKRLNVLNFSAITEFTDVSITGTI